MTTRSALEMTDRPAAPADVAAFITRTLNQFDVNVPAASLHHWLFLAQAWSLQMINRPAVDTQFRAATYQPQSVELLALKLGPYIVDEVPTGKPEQITGNNQVIFTAVIRQYGALSSIQLEDITAAPGTPWAETRTGNIIPNNAIRRFGKRLLQR